MTGIASKCSTFTLSLALYVMTLSDLRADDKTDLASAIRPGETISQFWELNGSRMALLRRVSKPSYRRIVYFIPRESLKVRGVETGREYFIGTKDGSRYKGISYLFGRNCGPLQYDVTGELIGVGDRIVMLGYPRVRGKDCVTKDERFTVRDVLELIDGNPSR